MRSESPTLPPLIVDFGHSQELSAEIRQQQTKPVKPMSAGRRFVQMDFLFRQMQKLATAHGPYGCGLENMQLLSEKHYGFRSCYTVQCDMCNVKKKFWTDPSPHSALAEATPNEPDINEAVVLSAMTSGLTYAMMSDFLGGKLNVPVCSATSFHKIHNKIENKIYEACVQDMIAAGNEEREIAEAKGQYVTVKGKQVPWISVIADGTWLRRSYKGNYASLMGAVSKI